MLGKASEIKVEFLDNGFVCDLQSDVNGFLNNHPDLMIVDIRRNAVVDETSANKIYHTALIIYKEESA